MSAKINATKSKDSGELIKNHHKQAFEYISKALRIDEDDTGLCVWLINWRVWQLVINIPNPICFNRRKGGSCAVVQERNCWAGEGHCCRNHRTRYPRSKHSHIHDVQCPHVLALCSVFFSAGEQYDRAKRLQDKMVTNLTMAKDRLALLGRWHTDNLICESLFCVHCY